MDPDVKTDIWSVMEDFSKDPGGKDLSKMKTQCDMSGTVDIPSQYRVTQ